jgi:hypothetical protein
VTHTRLVVDACVLFPTVMREMVLGVAEEGAFVPLWSGRLLDEWARAAARLGPVGEAQARAEIALIRAAWPHAEQPAAPGVEARLWLPDDNDIHVLATAVSASADGIMTLNAKDFPRGLLAEEGLIRVDPDSFLMQIWQANSAMVETVGARVLRQARDLSGTKWEMRALLKKARLPRLAKALG